ncbi:glycosyltransferase [Desulfomonile tiedjei]|uniref:Glycosyl transferase n=1 Tax=Desulfomonile tiedjei (strain ATCC 49306 / DSM 6799 / DCB-1) TaxID=706587 RepID=I4C9R3_DESTA|nr:glycosyltransferase [Desulfomonile tiedjei]AFM26304.1 glycosyl transferase [Desulfomonile tiedjei DSM 6799]
MPKSSAPLVSVVVPSYNHERYVKQALMSALASTIDDIEVVVVDDGSSDNSPEIIQSIDDPRIRFFSQSNSGAHAAINKGVELARSEWISILNSDDLYFPEKLQTHLEFHARHPELEASVSTVRYVDEEGEPLDGENESVKWYRTARLAYRTQQSLLKSLFVANHLVTTSSIFVKKQTLVKLGGFKSFRYVHDWFFFLSLARKEMLQVIDKPLVCYRLHGDNAVFENMDRLLAECHFVLEWHLHECARGKNPVLSIVEAHELLAANPLVDFQALALCQTWRESKKSDASKVFAGIDTMQNPVLKAILGIIKARGGEIAALRTENERLCQESQRLNHENHRINYQNHNLTGENVRLSTQCERMSGEHARLVQECYRLIAENERINRECERITSEYMNFIKMHSDSQK